MKKFNVRIRFEGEMTTKVRAKTKEEAAAKLNKIKISEHLKVIDGRQFSVWQLVSKIININELVTIIRKEEMEKGK